MLLLGELVRGIVSGWLQGRALGKAIPDVDKWFRLVASISVSAFLAFFGIFSVAGLAALAGGADIWHAAAIAVFTGAGGMAAAVLNLWKRSELTKGIPIWVPREVEEKGLETPGTFTQPGPPAK